MARRTSTMMMADIAGSTAVVSALGDRAWLVRLARHRAMVGAAVERHGGWLGETSGDGFLALFPAPTRALTCATQLRREVQELGFEHRTGLHTGDVECAGDLVAGLNVHVAARIMREASPGEVLVSSTAR